MVSVAYSWSWGGAVLASVQNIDEFDMLSFHSALQADKARLDPESKVNAKQRVDAVWWKPYASTNMFVFLGNSTDETTQVDVHVKGDAGEVLKDIPLLLAPHASTTLEIFRVLGVAQAVGSTGSISIDYTGPARSLLAYAGLEDHTNGFSANLHLIEAHSEKNRVKEVHAINIAIPGVMVGAQSPKMQFPQNIRFAPYLVLHNTAQAARTISVTSSYSVGGQLKTQPVAKITLLPKASGKLDFSALDIPTLDGGVVNLEETFSGSEGDIESEAGSTDQTGNYVFETEPQLEGWTISRTVCYWTITGDTNTMVSLWNYSASPQDLMLTFYYEGGSYRLPIYLEAGAASELDVASLVRSRKVDDRGAMFPSNITEGSALLSAVESEFTKMYVASSTSTFNVRTGTCTIQCGTCNGVTQAALIPVSFLLNSIGQTAQATGRITYNTGSYQDLTTGPNWSTNSSVASVNSSGVVTANQFGSNNASFDFNVIFYQSYICTGNSFYCPSGSVGGSGPISVKPTVSISPTTAPVVTAGAVDSSGVAKNYTLTATGSPGGGIYSWNISSGSGLTLSNTTLATVSMVGTASGTAVVSVTYSLNGQSSAPATVNVTVLQADRIYVLNDTSRTISCAGTLGLYCIERIISYEIRSGLTAITNPINMRENVPSTTDSCHNIVTTGSGGFVNVNASPGIFNQFEDHLLDCPFSFALACSFTFSNQQWQQRNANLTYSSIGTVGPVSVTSFSNANVANNSTSLTGQTFR